MTSSSDDFITTFLTLIPAFMLFGLVTWVLGAVKRKREANKLVKEGDAPPSSKNKGTDNMKAG